MGAGCIVVELRGGDNLRMQFKALSLGCNVCDFLEMQRCKICNVIQGASFWDAIVGCNLGNSFQFELGCVLVQL